MNVHIDMCIYIYESVPTYIYRDRQTDRDRDRPKEREGEKERERKSYRGRVCMNLYISRHTIVYKQEGNSKKCM